MNTEKPKFLMRSQVFKVVMMIHGDGNASNDLLLIIVVPIILMMVIQIIYTIMMIVNQIINTSHNSLSNNKH